MLRWPARPVLSMRRFTLAPPAPTLCEAWFLADGIPALAVVESAGRHIANENEQRWRLHACTRRVEFAL